jgi:hypothetical protein
MTKAAKKKTNGSKGTHIAPELGTLSARAILVDLDQHYWFGTTRDSSITEEVNTKYNSEGGYSKILIPRLEMKAMGSRFTEVRDIHKRYTLAWDNSGWRILSSAAYLEWDQKLRAAIAKANKAADEFVDKYEELVKAKEKEDKSFKREHYPTKEQLRAKYGFEVEYKPVPVSGDVRIHLSDEALAAVKASIDTEGQARIKTAILDIATRIREVVGNMVERLRAYKPPKAGAKAENAFKDSLIENVRDLAGLLPNINITADPRIDTMAAELLQLLPENVDNLRDDEKLRKETADAAAKILEKVGQFV